MEQEDGLSFDQRRLLRDKAIIGEELLRRRASDPLALFTPHPRQAPFIDAVLERRFDETYFFAANRAGKSDAGAYCGARLARFGRTEPTFHRAGGLTIKDYSTSGWVVSLDFPSSRDIIQPKYFDNGYLPPGATHQPFIPAHEIDRWDEPDQILKLKNGSIVGFKSAESGRIKFQGTEKDWIHFDEEPPEPIYNECVIRVGARPLQVFFTCTLLPPEGQVGGVTWLFEKKVKPWMEGTPESDRLGIFTASIYDNPYIPRAEIERLEAIYPEGSAQRRIRLNGELIPGLAGARIYAGFDHKLNIRKQGIVQLRRPLCWVWDFNVEPMVSLVGQREAGVFKVFQELLLEEANIQEMCEYFRMKYPSHLAEVQIFGDSKGKDRSHHDKRTSYQLILNEMKDYNAPMKMKVPETNPMVTARVNAVNRACRDENGEVRLEIDPSCRELIADLEQVLSDGRGGIKKTYNKKDPYARRTHTSDALGYWISYEAPVRASGDTARPRGAKIKDPGYGARA